MGPLAGIRVLELAGIGPGPFCAMVLADLGADVLRVERPGGGAPVDELLLRGRPAVAIDLTHPDGVAAVLDLADRADALLEGFRPGVTERLGVGPDAQALARNPRLVYGRVTGWGRDGPLAHAAGHDIDYIALAGCLALLGRAGQPPAPPLNLVGDYAGGGLLLALGVVAALLEARRSGRGQVVDAAMVDGTALLMTLFHGLAAAGLWRRQREANLLDGGAPFYATYETADGRYVAVGALEPAFYAELLAGLGLADDPALAAQMDRARWPAARRRLAAAFRTRTRDEWCALFDGRDACVAPVLSLDEAAAHPHNRARGTFVEVAGVVQPAPAPRFSRTPCAAPSPPRRPSDPAEPLAAWGLPASASARLRAAGALRAAGP